MVCEHIFSKITRIIIYIVCVKRPYLRQGTAPVFIEYSGSIARCTVGILRYGNRTGNSSIRLQCPTCISKNTIAFTLSASSSALSNLAERHSQAVLSVFACITLCSNRNIFKRGLHGYECMSKFPFFYFNL